MADEKPQKTAAAAKPQNPAAAAGDEGAREALDANRDQRQAADEQVGPQVGRVPLPDQDAPESFTLTQTLAGVQPAGVREAGGRGAARRARGGRPVTRTSRCLARRVSRLSVPAPRCRSRRRRRCGTARTRGSPSRRRSGPVQNVSLYDTPGGYQTVPAGLTPEDLVVETGSRLAPRAGQAVRRPFGEEAGAENRHVGGAAPGQRASQTE
jgi:hypothetical protein